MLFDGDVDASDIGDEAVSSSISFVIDAFGIFNEVFMLPLSLMSVLLLALLSGNKNCPVKDRTRSSSVVVSRSHSLTAELSEDIMVLEPEKSISSEPE